MTAIAAGRPGGGVEFSARHPADRTFFLVMTALLWVGIVAGFGSDIVQHFKTHEAPYPLIVHVHAAAMTGWLVLFTTQVGLIRSGRPDLHRRLGLAGLALAILMILLGPTTALTVDALHFAADHKPPIFMAIQFEDIAVFATLVGAALLFRATPATHKRLMLLALIQISDAGFARWFGDAVHGALGTGYFANFLGLYVGNDTLLLAFGAYDLATRKRLHPAYLAGASLIVVGQLFTVWLWHAPFWAGVSTHLIGR